MPVGSDIFDQNAREHARAGHTIGPVVDHGGDVDLRIDPQIMRFKAHPLPISHRAKALIGRHAHDEFKRAPVNDRMRIDLEHAEIRHHPVGHFLDRIIGPQPQLVRHRCNQRDVKGMLGIGETIKQALVDQARLLPADRADPGV